MKSLATAIRTGDRRALARGITLVESTRRDHRDEAVALLEELLPHTGRAVRIGISGAPGVGKSTFIEAFGRHLTGEGLRVAVLAVDPSSTRSGGSILGDKTRMAELARDPNAFIRPSPSGGTLGGVARRTREAMLLCEAAGFDVVVVETVGVGQSEIEVDGMVDVFVLLVQPGGGDELQGMKRGIVELADIVVVTKADGALAAAAEQAKADYAHALRFLRPKHVGWSPPVVTVSSVTGDGIAAVWESARAVSQQLGQAGVLAERRREQVGAALRTELRESLLGRLLERSDTGELVRQLDQEVRNGQTTPAAATARIVAALIPEDG